MYVVSYSQEKRNALRDDPIRSYPTQKIKLDDFDKHSK